MSAEGAGAAREKGLKSNKWHEKAIHKIVGMPNNEAWIEENHMAWLQLKTKRLDKAKVKLNRRIYNGRRTGTMHRRKILRMNREGWSERKRNKGEDDTLCIDTHKSAQQIVNALQKFHCAVGYTPGNALVCICISTY